MCAPERIEVTEEMIQAGCDVPWVRAYQGEFEGFEPEHDAVMRALVSELWLAMTSARDSE